VCLWSLPLPWLAAELGWYVAEGGRQPWTIDGVLPTFLSASSVSASNVWLSLGAFVIFYSALATVDAVLMVRTVRIGPAPSHPAAVQSAPIARTA
jgi:cytochrome d ubiquinol oxidase subunit I